MEAPYDEQKFEMRGQSMTRIETFVAATFAFATTMLMISVGELPDSIESFMVAVKTIPSFLASCALLVWIWYSHADWSRKYGLEDPKTILLSATLIATVLIYIYPLRLMAQGFFASMSGGYFPFELNIRYLHELRFLFVFYAIGFTLLAANFWYLFKHAYNKKVELALNEFEAFDTRWQVMHWQASTLVCLSAVFASSFVPDQFLTLSPYIFCLLFPANFIIGKRKKDTWNELVKQRAN